MYAAMAYCNIGFMQAIMTFDRENIAQSLVDIDAAMQVIEGRGRGGGGGGGNVKLSCFIYCWVIM